MAQLTVVEIANVAGFDALTEQLPNKRHRYRLRDPASVSAGELPLCRHVLRRAGCLQINRVDELFGTEVGIEEPGIPAYCFATLHSGAMALFLPGRAEAVEGGPARGLIHGGQDGTRALTQNGTVRTNIWVAHAAVERAMSAQLGEVLRTPVIFRPEIDWTAGAGLSVQRLVVHAAAEFERPDGMSVQPLALAAFTDLFVQAVLTGLPHSHSERLLQARATATPRHLRRAEAFMRASADQPVNLADIAAAANCSVRSLHSAFGQFRETTPHKALQTIRLERAAADLQRCEETVAVVARRYGFSHPGRFATLYARRYGQRPRGRRDTGDEAM